MMKSWLSAGVFNGCDLRLHLMWLHNLGDFTLAHAYAFWHTGVGLFRRGFRLDVDTAFVVGYLGTLLEPSYVTCFSLVNTL
jgi:hypothetical protein